MVALKTPVFKVYKNLKYEKSLVIQVMTEDPEANDTEPASAPGVKEGSSLAQGPRRSI